MPKEVGGTWSGDTHRAAIHKRAVGESTVAFAPELDLVGALEEQGLLEVTSLLVHVGYAVLAVIGDVLGGLGGHQAQEGQLDSDIGRIGTFASILELESIGHALSKPDMLLLLGVWADVPVLLRHRGLSGEHTGLTCLHVAVDLDGIQVAALVRVDPVLS